MRLDRGADVVVASRSIMAGRFPTALRWSCLAAPIFAMLSCNVFVNVPAESAGDMSMSLKNWLDHDLCEFSMSPRGASAQSANWLKHDVGPGSGRSFKIKPGDYHVELGCPGQFHGVADLRLTASTEINIGVAAAARRYPRPFVPVTGNVKAYVPPVSTQPVAEEPAPEGGEAAEPKRDCWPDGHTCAFATDPCCSTCGNNPNTHRMECY